VAHAPLRRSPRVAIVVTLVLLFVLPGPAAVASPTSPDPGADHPSPWWTWHPPDHLDDREAQARATGRRVRYALPVAGGVLRRFEAPTTAFGSGHRGVDLAAAPGDAIRAAADGAVTFAGVVAGVRWVSVAHADGILTSYGPIAAAEVSRGDIVTRGTRLGTLAAGGHGDGARDRGLHWGARREGRYLDPMTLLDDGVPRPSLVEPGSWRGTDHAVTPYAGWEGARWAGLGVHPSPVADRPGYPIPPGPNRLVLLSGLNSGSGSRPIDPAHLGYDPASVSRFAYPGADPGALPERYGPEDTWHDIDRAARGLREQLRALAAAEPGRAVDLVGHSLGGVVALVYLSRYHDPYDRTLPPIGSVVTIASPHRGTDLANVGVALRDHLVVGLGLLGARPLADRVGAVPRFPLHDEVLDDLRVGSALTGRLATDWQEALAAGPAGPLAMGTRVLTIGATGDQVVPIVRSGQPTPRGWVSSVDLDLTAEAAVDHRVLPGGHDAVLHTEALREVVWRFLAGEEVVASPGYGRTWSSALQAGSLHLLAGGVQVHDLRGTVRAVAGGVRMIASEVGRDRAAEDDDAGRPWQPSP
jgi:murein DD-endopeptidase MepM/ murein hydrolase activator NlpD